MKKLSLLHVVCLCLLLTAVSSSQPKLTIVGGANFEFGDVFTDMAVKKIITLKNEGNKTLTISNVSTTCGCTAALLSNPDIPPGDSGLLSISFDGKKFSGVIKRSVSFETNDPEQKKIHVNFSANVVKLLSIEPEYLMFNRVFLDSSSSQSLFIKNNSEETIKVLSLNTTTDLVIPKAEKTILKPNDSTYITCTFRPKAVGAISGNINIETDHPKVKTVSIRFMGYGSKPSRIKAEAH
jgi:hypothetical protein